MTSIHAFGKKHACMLINAYASTDSLLFGVHACHLYVGTHPVCTMGHAHIVLGSFCV